MPNEEKTVDQVQPKRSEPAKYLTDTDDKFQRCLNLNFRMDFLNDPDEAMAAYMPEDAYKRWAEYYNGKIIEWTAEYLQIDPAQIADPAKRTQEQQNAIDKTVVLSLIKRRSDLQKSNFMAAIHTVNEYCMAIAEAGQDDIYKPLREESMPEELKRGELSNVPLAAVLYFFATHLETNPEDADTMTPEDNQALLDIFARMDAFYMEHRAEIHSEGALLKAFIAAENPNPEQAQAIEQAAQEIRAIMPTKTDIYSFSIAKPFRDIFNPNADYSSGEALIATGKGGMKSGIYTRVLLNPHGARRLDGTDERIHNALYTIWQAQEGKPDQGHCTLTDILNAAKLANTESRRKMVLESLRTMNSYEVTLTNEDEIAAGYNYPDTSLNDDCYGRIVSFQTEPQKVNGKTTDKGIQFLEPVLGRYSRKRGQISAVKIEVLDYPVNNSPATIAIANYLIYYLAWKYNEYKKRCSRLERLLLEDSEDKQAQITALKREIEAPISIRYDTLYEKAQAVDRKQQFRTRTASQTMLEHWMTNRQQHIGSVKKGKEGFALTLYLNDDK